MSGTLDRSHAPSGQQAAATLELRPSLLPLSSHQYPAPIAPDPHKLHTFQY